MSCPRGCCESFAEHIRSVFVATAALVDANNADRRLARDLAAFKRLDEGGNMPPRVDGSAEREARAEHPEQVEGRPRIDVSA